MNETFHTGVAPPLESYTQAELIESVAGPQGTATYDEMEYDPIAKSRLSSEWKVNKDWGEEDIEDEDAYGGVEWYSPEMLKARNMKNRYVPSSVPMQKRNGRKYLFLDFDNTVRHTVPDPKSHEPARRRPPHKAYEVVMIEGMPEKVRRWMEAGYFIIGLTNQSNIESGFNTNQDVVDTIIETLNQLGLEFPVYYASHKNPSLPDYNLRKPQTGMIDAAFRDFGNPDMEYTVMVGDDWEGADSGMASNAGVHFIGVLPFLNISVQEAEDDMQIAYDEGERLCLLNPDDLIPTFAEEYSRLLTTHRAESSNSKSATRRTGITMFGKNGLGLWLGVAGGLLLGWNAPTIWNKITNKEQQASESIQSDANQGYMVDFTGGERGGSSEDEVGEGQHGIGESNKLAPAPLKYDYDPLASGDAQDYDPQTRPPSVF